MSLAAIVAFLSTPVAKMILSMIFGYILRHFGVGMGVAGKFLPEVEAVAATIVKDEPTVKSELSALFPNMSNKVGASLDELQAIAQGAQSLLQQLQPLLQAAQSTASVSTPAAK